MKYRIWVVGLLAATFMAGCTQSKVTAPAVSESTTPFSVYTVNYPLAYFAERIAGDAAEVHFPREKTGGDPAFWKPDGDTIRAFQQADMILLNGADYAKWVPMATLPESKLVNTSKAFESEYLHEEGAVTHSHGPEGVHTHGELQFITWLDFTQAAKQAEAIAKALTEALPDQATGFNERLEALKQDLQGLDKLYEDAFAAVDGAPLLASHPVYGYMQRRYDLNLENMHWEPGDMPDDAEWTGLEKLLEEHPAKIMLWEGTPLAETKAKLEALGVQVWVLSPCGGRPAEGDWLSVMQAAATK